MYLKRLRELRKETGLSQTDIAKKIGLKQNALSRYELGKCSIPVKYLIRLADTYEVSVDYILERSNLKDFGKWC